MALSTFLRGRGAAIPRGLQAMAFSEQAIIQAPAVAGDSGGGGTTSWSAAGTTVCRIYPVTIRGKGALIGGQINERTTHFCSMPAGVAVNTADRILIGSRGTFEVTMALETTDALSTRVEVVQISP